MLSEKCNVLFDVQIQYIVLGSFINGSLGLVPIDPHPRQNRAILRRTRMTRGRTVWKISELDKKI